MQKEKVLTKKSAMQLMYEELIAHEYTIPLELIVKCKELIELEQNQIIEAHLSGFQTHFFYNLDETMIYDSPEDYYNETYGGKNEQD
jgi:hypothetical protein